MSFGKRHYVVIRSNSGVVYREATQGQPLGRRTRPPVREARLWARFWSDQGTIPRIDVKNLYE